MKKLSKKELIKALEKAEKNPRDIGGLIGDFSVVGLSGVGSVALASTLLTTTTTTTVAAPVLGSTFLGSLLGARVLVTLVVAAPTLAVVVSAIGGIILTQGLIKLIKSGSNNDNKRAGYIKGLKEKILAFDNDVFFSTDNSIKISKLSGIYVLLLKLNIVNAEGVGTMFAGVSNGSINIDLALTNAKLMLESLSSEQRMNNINLS
jgi:hypothetical protein